MTDLDESGRRGCPTLRHQWLCRPGCRSEWTWKSHPRGFDPYWTISRLLQSGTLAESDYRISLAADPRNHQT